MTVARRAGLRAAQVLFAAGLIALLLRAASPATLWAMRATIDLRLWALAAVLIGLMHVLGWLALMVLVSSRPPGAYSRTWLAYGHVQAVALFTPAQAGEALLPVLYARAGLDGGATAAALIVQRIVTLAIMGAAAALFAAGHIPPLAAIVLVVAVGLGLGLGLALVRSRRVRARWTRVGTFLQSVEAAARRIAFEEHGSLASHVVLMVARFAVAVAASWLMCRSFGIQAPYLEIAGLSAASTIAALVPLSPGGLGVTEGIFVAALRHRGYGVEQIVGASLAGRLVAAVLLGTFALAYATSAGRGRP